VFVIDTKKKITQAGVEDSSTQVFPIGTTIISARGTVGKVALVGVPMAMNQSCYGIRGKVGKKGYYTYFATRALVSTLQQHAHGSVFDTITRDTLTCVQFAVSPATIIEEFEEKVSPLMDRILNNLFESRTLTALRDALLPKLLSGELRVPQTKQSTSKIIPLFAQEPAKPTRKTTDEFVEAVAIAHLTRRLFNGTHPLGRKRCNKLSYLAHRRIEDDVTEHYLKKAAGPYSPWAKYQGPEGIALKRGYVKNGKVGDFTGFLPGDNIAEIDRYVPNYPICAAIDWVVSKFRFKKNDELELLATVDYAALDLLREGKTVSLDGIKDIIATNKEWAAKLKREIFSDANITKALTELRGVFPKTYTT
jgi:type I restriction enzyme S subunit